MEEKLKKMFPAGEWGTGQKAWMVKDGTYFCAAADIVNGEIVLTELGRRLSAPSVDVPKVEIPTFTAPKQVKKTGIKV